jgi:hypothetical protein
MCSRTPSAQTSQFDTLAARATPRNVIGSSRAFISSMTARTLLRLARL